MDKHVLKIIEDHLEAMKHVAGSLHAYLPTLQACPDYHKVTSPENTPPFGSDTPRVSSMLAPLIDKYRECYPQDPLDGQQLNDAELCAQIAAQMQSTAAAMVESTNQIAAYHRGRLNAMTRDAYQLLHSQRDSRTLDAETRAKIEIDLRPATDLIDMRKASINNTRLRTVGRNAQAADTQDYIETLEAENLALRAGVAPAPVRKPACTARTMPLPGGATPAPRRARLPRRPR